MQMENDEKELEKLKKQGRKYNKIIVIAIIIAVVDVCLLTMLIISSGARMGIDDPIIDTKEAFNQKFEQYCGNKIRGAQVRALIQAINTNNSATEDESRKVILEGKTNKSEIRTGNTYNVEITEYTKQGLINRIRITENENKILKDREKSNMEKEIEE